MRETPHDAPVLQGSDIERVLDRFDEEYQDSLIERRFTLDTSKASVAETFQEFREHMGPYLSSSDRLRMLSSRLP